MKLKKFVVYSAVFGGIMLFLGIFSVMATYFYLAPSLPSVKVLKDVQLQTPMQVFSSDGKLISQFGEQRRIPLTLEQMPEDLINAFLAIEDIRFYEHKGVDPIGIIRAAILLISTGEKRQGASTITMQLARNFFLSRDKTYIRKIKEIFIALHIERLLSKDEILELYLNKIALGHRSFGVGAAAQVYYGKDIKDLNIAQLAVIAGLPKAPSVLNPLYSPKRAKERRDIVLKRMLDVGFIDPKSYLESLKFPIETSYHGPDIEFYAPYASELVRQHVINMFGAEDAYSGGYNVYATIDSKLQESAKDSATNNLLAYDKRHGFQKNKINYLWQKNNIPPFEDIISYLYEQKSIPNLEHAVVLEVNQERAILQLKENRGIINYQGVIWARDYITDTTQGNTPETILDVLEPGAHIIVKRLSLNEELSVSMQQQNNAQIEDDQELVSQVDYEKNSLEDMAKNLVYNYDLAQYPEANIAFVAIDKNNGAILAMLGGYDFLDSEFNRVTQSKRQVGSVIKPFTYAAALNSGFTLATITNDAPINEWDSSQGVAWRPKNSPAIYEGPLRLREAFGKSKNVVSIRVIRNTGLNQTRNFLTNFGFASKNLPKNESLALGSASLTPIEITRAMASIANGGFLIEPYILDRIENENSDIVYQSIPLHVCFECQDDENEEQQTDDELAYDFSEINELNAKDDTKKTLKMYPEHQVDPIEQAPQVISEQTSFLMRRMLESSIWGGGSWANGTGWNGTGWRAARALKRRDIGGKTGTTNENKDAWFSGFGANIVATTWIGFDDPKRTLGSTKINSALPRNQQTIGGEGGAKTALPAWIDFMKEALKDEKEQNDPMPKNIITVNIDDETGKLSTKSDHTSKFEYFIEGTEPKEYIQETYENSPQEDMDLF